MRQASSFCFHQSWWRSWEHRNGWSWRTGNKFPSHHLYQAWKSECSHCWRTKCSKSLNGFLILLTVCCSSNFCSSVNELYWLMTSVWWSCFMLDPIKMTGESSRTIWPGWWLLLATNPLPFSSSMKRMEAKGQLFLWYFQSNFWHDTRHCSKRLHKCT